MLRNPIDDSPVICNCLINRVGKLINHFKLYIIKAHIPVDSRDKNPQVYLAKKTISFNDRLKTLLFCPIDHIYKFKLTALFMCKPAQSKRLWGHFVLYPHCRRKDGRFLNREEWNFSPEKLTKCERSRGKINPAR